MKPYCLVVPLTIFPFETPLAPGFPPLCFCHCFSVPFTDSSLPVLKSLFFRAHCNWSIPPSLHMVPFSIFLRLQTLKSVFLMQTLSTEFQTQISSDWQNITRCPVNSTNSVSQTELIILLPKQVSHCFLYLPQWLEPPSKTETGAILDFSSPTPNCQATGMSISSMSQVCPLFFSRL